LPGEQRHLKDAPDFGSLTTRWYHAYAGRFSAEPNVLAAAFVSTHLGNAYSLFIDSFGWPS